MTVAVAAMAGKDSVAAVQQIEGLPARIEAALVGVCVGEAAAGLPAGAADLLGVAESVAATGGFDPEDLRRRGLEHASKSGSAGLLLRGLPFGLLTPNDRPRLRRDAYRCVALAGADEATAITSVAAAILSADLLRFDLVTALVRLRQSLLEDAPLALLERFRLPPVDAPAPAGQDPGSVFQSAIGALGRAEGVVAAVRAAVDASPVATGLAGALAGARDGLEGITEAETRDVPHAERAVAIARRMGERALESSLPAVGAS
jgi:hypothetical protein